MIGVPSFDIPVTLPDDGFTVASEVLLLLQVPPLIPLFNTTDELMHTALGPVIAVGAKRTVCDPPLAIVPKVVRNPADVVKFDVVIGLTTIVRPATADDEISAVIQ